MQIHTVTISYRRQSQPAQYEAEEARIEGSATVDEGEDFEAIAYDLIARARVQAHRALGLKVPAIQPYVCAFAALNPVVETATVDFSQAQPAVEQEAAKRKRRTKAEMEAARAAEAADKSGGVVDVTDDFVIGGAPTPAAAPVDDFVIGEPAKEIKDGDLQAAAAAAARKIGANGAEKVKGLMREFNVARLGEIAQEKRAVFLAQLEGLAAK